MYCIIHKFPVAGSTRSYTQYGAFRSVFKIFNGNQSALLSRLDLLCFAFFSQDDQTKSRNGVRFGSAPVVSFMLRKEKTRLDFYDTPWPHPESSLAFCTCSTLFSLFTLAFGE